MGAGKQNAGREIGWVDDSLWHCLLARLQILLRRSRIKIVHSNYYQADIRKANLVYCCLDVKILREIYKNCALSPSPALTSSAPALSFPTWKR